MYSNLITATRLCAPKYHSSMCCIEDPVVLEVVTAASSTRNSSSRPQKKVSARVRNFVDSDPLGPETLRRGLIWRSETRLIRL